MVKKINLSFGKTTQFTDVQTVVVPKCTLRTWPAGVVAVSPGVGVGPDRGVVTGPRLGINFGIGVGVGPDMGVVT